MQREKGDFQTGMTAGLKVSGTVEGRRSQYLLKYQWCIAHCNFLCRTKKGEMTTCLPRIICTDVKLRPGGQNWREEGTMRVRLTREVNLKFRPMHKTWLGFYPLKVPEFLRIVLSVALFVEAYLRHGGPIQTLNYSAAYELIGFFV